MGNVFNYSPPMHYVYDKERYDPFKFQLQSVSKPSGGVALSLPVTVDEFAIINPAWKTVLGSSWYKAAWDNRQRRAYYSDKWTVSEEFKREPIRPGMRAFWGNGEQWSDHGASGSIFAPEYCSAK